MPIQIVGVGAGCEKVPGRREAAGWAKNPGGQEEETEEAFQPGAGGFSEAQVGGTLKP